VLTDFLGKGATVNLEHCIESLKSLKNTSQGRGQKLMMSCFNKTMPGLAQVPPQLMPFYVLWFTVLPYLTYSLYVAPVNFHFFSKLKEDLRDQNFISYA